MGFLSQGGHLGFKTQATKGTYRDPGATAPNNGVFTYYRSGSMGGNRDLMVPDPEIGGNRDVPDAQLGPISFSGDFDVYLRMESLAFFLTACLGASAVTGSGTTGYTHTITPTDTLPWVSIEEQIGVGTAGGPAYYEAFKYTDSKVNTFHMEADAGGYLTGTVGLVAISQAILATPTILASQRIDTSPLLVGTNITVAWNAVALPAKSFSLDITNNIENDDFRMGSLTLGQLVEKRRELTMGVTIRPDDSALWRTAMWGGPAATQPLGQSFKDDVTITIASYEDIPGATAGVKYQAVFTIPQAIIEPFTPAPSGDDVLQHDISIRAVRPSPATPIMTTTVKNSYATMP
jgi:hypothetical protein